MGPKYEPRSKIYELDPIEADDELDLEMSRLYAEHRNVAKNKSEIELHNYLQDKASQNKKEYNEVVSALLYGALTEAGNARMFFQSIASVNRDNYFVLIQKLQSILISVKFQHLRSQARDQVFWLISELTNLGAQHVDSLYMILMRQIRGGDTSQANAVLCDHILRLFELHKSWLETNPKVIPIAVYTYLRVIADHRTLQLQTLQQKEIRFVHMLMREKWMHCVPIGRDLVRVLHDLSPMPEFAQIWDDLLNNPQKLSPKFGGVQSMLKSPTPRDFLKCRLTPDIEHKLLYILQNLRINHFQKNLNWFTQRFLNTPESEPFYVDIVRYLVAGWYPSNQILQSDIVPRYVVIGSMIRAIKSNVVATNVKTALIYDWLFFKPTDNIMFIEPAMLLMERSAERYPAITATLMEFLKHSVDRYFPPMKDYMAQSVACGMRLMLSKGVIRSLIPIYRCPATEAATKEYMQDLFSEFLVEDSHQQAQGPPSLPSSVTMHASIPPPSTVTPDNSHKSQPNTPKSEPAEMPSEQDDGEMEEGEEREIEPPTTSKAIKEDDDEDAYLYGESDSNNRNQAVQEDEEMENVNDTATEDLPVLSTIVAGENADENTVEEVTMADADEEQMATDDDYEEDDESTEGLQSNQSYWIFGDSLKRFKEACLAVKSAQKEADSDEYNVQILIVKKSLKEILAVFLRMAIPAETLATTVGPSIRNMVTSNLFTHTTTTATLDEDSILTDSNKDAFDFVMSTFWNVRAIDASSDKIVRLIGCIAHNNKVKGRRHVIGMRWWAFMAAQLQVDANNDDDWFPNILNSYEAYVLHAYAVEESEMDQSEYFKEYLRGDLEMLAEHNVAFFNTIIPLIYQYLPNATVGNTELLRITLLVLLPDAMGQITCSMQFGNIRIFGDNIDTNFLERSLVLPAYETMYYWQLLAAEIQCKSNRIEQFFQMDQVVAILKTRLKNELMPSLMSVLTSVPPSKDLLDAIVRIVPKQHKFTQPQVQLVLASLQYWSMNSTESFTASLNELIEGFTDQVESETSELEEITTLVSLLDIWWHQKTASETFRSDKTLLSKVSKLCNLVGYKCPKEWNQELARKKKRSILLDSDEDEDEDA